MHHDSKCQCIGTWQLQNNAVPALQQFLSQSQEILASHTAREALQILFSCVLFKYFLCGEHAYQLFSSQLFDHDHSWSGTALLSKLMTNCQLTLFTVTLNNRMETMVEGGCWHQSGICPPTANYTSTITQCVFSRPSILITNNSQRWSIKYHVGMLTVTCRLASDDWQLFISLVVPTQSNCVDPVRLTRERSPCPLVAIRASHQPSAVSLSHSSVTTISGQTMAACPGN